MALDTLATGADLTVRGIDITSEPTRTALLKAASAAIRDAAGTPIKQTSSTIKVVAPCAQWLDVPLVPVTAVTAVSVDGILTSDYKLVDGRLWRRGGWAPRHDEPYEVTITATHGYAEVPDDVVDLACSLVAAAKAALEDGYEPARGLSAVSIDDYRESYTRGDDEVINPMELPERTRTWLRRRFRPQDSAAVIGSDR